MPPPDPDLTPAQERTVRARLTDARHDEPVPDDVAARLDATLAGLVADRAGDASHSGERVVELRSRRRRVTAGLLAAAAVVVVGGVVGGQVLGDGSVLPTVGGSADSAGGAESAEESDGGDAATAEPGERSRQGTASDGIEDPSLDAERDAPSDTLDELAAQAAPTVGPDTLAADAARLRARAGRATYTTRDGTATVEEACRVSARGGRRVLVTYEQQPGVLVYRAPRSGSQQVELHLCGSLAPRRVAEIPGP